MSKKKILFLCTGNSCRSQMAEGLCRDKWSDEFEIYSAGTEKHGLNPNAVKVLEEIGIDIRKHYSKNLDDIGPVHFDYVFTVCGHAQENCPYFPGNAKKIHVGFDDPPRLAKEIEDPEKALDVYRRVRDQIKEFILNIKEKMGE